jgi:hypothetical protein
MKFRIEICGFSKDVDSMFDLLSNWKELQQVGVQPHFISTYELNSQYEWVELDAQHIWNGMSRLLAVK